MAKAREAGIRIGALETGKHNCITDVQGVAAGHVTLDYPLGNGEYACTGVTAILPHQGNLFREKVVGAAHVFNGFGKTTGLVQVEELGVLEAPVLLTNTFGVPAVTQGALEYMLERTPEIGEDTGTINIVVTECNDMHLNSIRHMPLQPAHAVQALEAACCLPLEEGAVGAGKGMTCFGYKGGIGSSSRLARDDATGACYTVGVLALTNFGRKEDFRAWQYQAEGGLCPNAQDTPDGSIIMVLATDAPLSDRQLKRVIRRCGNGLGRTGSNFDNGSGDIVVGFSTAQRIPHRWAEARQTASQLREDSSIMARLFTAAADATEEAVINSLLQAKTTHGRKGRVVYSYLEGR